MHESRVASRYAKSLIDLAKEKGALEIVEKDMSLFVQIGEANFQFLQAMKNPIVSNDKKLAILESIFKGKVSEFTMAMFTLTTNKNRAAYLFDVAKEFKKQYRVLNGIEVAEITTTFPLTDNLREKFISLIGKAEKKKVELREKIDINILGGYVLKIGDRQVDESVKNKLTRLKTSFKDNSYTSKY